VVLVPLATSEKKIVTTAVYQTVFLQLKILFIGTGANIADVFSHNTPMVRSQYYQNALKYKILIFYFYSGF